MYLDIIHNKLTNIHYIKINITIFNFLIALKETKIDIGQDSDLYSQIIHLFSSTISFNNRI